MKTYAKCKKPGEKDRVLYDSLHMQYPELVNPQEQKGDQWLSGSLEKTYDCLRDMWLFWGIRKMFWKQIEMVIGKLCASRKHCLNYFS